MKFGFVHSKENKTPPPTINKKAAGLTDCDNTSLSQRTNCTEASAEWPCPPDSPSSSNLSSSKRNVRFSDETPTDASPAPEECFRDPSLWYQRDELASIRQKCQNQVHCKARQFENCGLVNATNRFVKGGYQSKPSKQKGPHVQLQNQLAKASRDNVRGLEHFAAASGSYGEHHSRPWWTEQHNRRVLKAQRCGRNVASAALKTSQPCAHLAREKAKQDALQVGTLCR